MRDIVPLKRALGLVAALLLVVSLGGCADRQRKATKVVNQIGPTVLAAETDALRPAQGAEAIREVPESSWTPSLRRLEPKSVRVDTNGVFVVRWKRLVEEEGIFVAFPGIRIDTEPGQDPSFTKIAERVYSYKIRG